MLGALEARNAGRSMGGRSSRAMAYPLQLMLLGDTSGPASSPSIITRRTSALEDDESGAYAAIEVFYTGRQALEDNQYATVSKPYTTLGILLSDNWRSLTVFANGENLTDVRLTRFQPLLRTQPGEGGRWTVDSWAPLEGRRLNVGVRWRW
jgi:hypothetical protein